jgi:hypothetical protein
MTTYFVVNPACCNVAAHLCDNCKRECETGVGLLANQEGQAIRAATESAGWDWVMKQQAEERRLFVNSRIRHPSDPLSTRGRQEGREYPSQLRQPEEEEALPVVNALGEVPLPDPVYPW